MHHHAYLWLGPKPRFDTEALRRPVHPDPPPAGSKPELIHRYREVAAEFRTVDLPPLETVNWLAKPGELVRGTWQEPKGAAVWIGQRLAEYAPRFASAAERDTTWLAVLVNSAAERLSWGRDVSYGFYLERPAFLSLAVVCCSPGGAGAPRADRALGCPLAGSPEQASNGGELAARQRRSPGLPVRQLAVNSPEKPGRSP